MQATIIGWNPLLDGTNHIRPSVYIQPTLELLQFFQRAILHRGVVEIEGTDSCYDGVNLFATIDKSSNVPNCRQNFFNGTGLYVITLEAMWNGYPPKAGIIKFKEGIVNELVKYASPSLASVASVSSPSPSVTSSASNSTSAPIKPKAEDVENYQHPESSPVDEPNILSLSSRSLWIITVFFLILLGWTVYESRRRSNR